MKEDDFFHNELIVRFEAMIREGQIIYFDAEEFSDIIMYYLDLSDLDYANKALFLPRQNILIILISRSERPKCFWPMRICLKPCN